MALQAAVLRCGCGTRDRMPHLCKHAQRGETMQLRSMPTVHDRDATLVTGTFGGLAHRPGTGVASTTPWTLWRTVQGGRYQ